VKFHIGGTVNFDRIILENSLSTASRYLGGPEHVVRPVGIKITNSYLVTVFIPMEFEEYPRGLINTLLLCQFQVKVIIVTVK
jgi:hypothetical protein